ncbi:hypothetical protein K2173_024355 [Erythroxylum novogranatense]|uniref:Beta-fructofuranosidase n=1 Tax=Erythroxylum novogranatense TaxID=1862640 RepID=A0AAV8SUU7_9ROSI|nr:hypothetical protein K2173_024355 [Erythroxylum novogranatense]
MNLSSLSFCFLPFALLLLSNNNAVLQVQASHQIYSHLGSLEATGTSFQPYRTAYHFQPRKNWMNDPNGPMIYKGIYHLFYQYNPYCAQWGNIVWAHSTSRDLINWTPHEIALWPCESSDVYGAWSGSITIHPGGEPILLYTGVNRFQQQVQNMAVPKDPSDPYLRKWVKSGRNPLMAPTPENQINASSFRDPTTAWLGPDGKWRVLVGSKINSQGLAILYTSQNFTNWTQSLHPLHSAMETGMWECPDFFPVNVHGTDGLETSLIGSNLKHVLKVSLDDTKHDYYTIGVYDHVKDFYTPDKDSVEGDSGLRYDYGKFYASKTFYDSDKKRRILWGWINESSSTEDDARKGWSGVQAIPRSLWLHKSGKQLIQWPIKELETLRTNPVNLPSQVLERGSVLQVSGVTAAQADVEISFKVSKSDKADVLDPSWTNPQLLCSQKGAIVKGSLGPFGLLILASKDMQEYTSVFFRIFKGKNSSVVLMCSDQSRSSLNHNNDMTTYGTFLDLDPVHENLSLRTLIDHSIVESFGGEGKVCITSRVYPTLAINQDAHMFAFNNGTENVMITSLSAWSMKKALIN